MEEVKTTAHIVCNCLALASIMLRVIGWAIIATEQISLKYMLNIMRRSMGHWELYVQSSNMEHDHRVEKTRPNAEVLFEYILQSNIINLSFHKDQIINLRVMELEIHQHVRQIIVF